MFISHIILVVLFTLHDNNLQLCHSHLPPGEFYLHDHIFICKTAHFSSVRKERLTHKPGFTSFKRPPWYCPYWSQVINTGPLSCLPPSLRSAAICESRIDDTTVSSLTSTAEQLRRTHVNCFLQVEEQSLQCVMWDATNMKLFCFYSFPQSLPFSFLCTPFFPLPYIGREPPCGMQIFKDPTSQWWISDTQPHQSLNSSSFNRSMLLGVAHSTERRGKRLLFGKTICSSWVVHHAANSKNIFYAYVMF